MTNLSSIAAAADSRPSPTGCSPAATAWPSWPGPTGASSVKPASPEPARGRVHVRDLLARAAERYDAPGSPLRAAAAGAARGGFASGAQWMRLVLETLRGRPCPPTAFNYQRLGLIKYGLAGGVALLWAVAACAWHVPWLVPLAAVAFYAVEAQMVFLFPLALDGR